MSGSLSSLRARVILTYLIIFLVSAAILIGRAGALFAENAIASAEHDLEVQAYVTASVLARPWLARDNPGWDTTAFPQVQKLPAGAQETNIQLTLLDAAGAPVVTSLAAMPANQSAEPEVASALDGEVDHALRIDPVSGKRLIYAAAPVEVQGHIFGVVQMSIPLAQVTARTEQFWLGLGGTALIAAAVSALAGWWLASQVARPVLRLRDAAIRLAAGNLDERVQANGFAEMSQLAGAFNHMAARVQDMILHQRAFVANASHELRTPLTNIKLRAEALSNGALGDPSVALRFSQEIESEANRLSRMASDLLTLSRQDESAPAPREAIAPAAAIEEAVGELALRAEKAGVALRQELAPDLPLVEADPVGLRTVLVNLLDNALQYTAAGGSVTIRAHAQPTRLVVEVADTGVGIASEDLPHIFERFYRADKSRSRRAAQQPTGSGTAGSGAGLGLAIAHGIIEHQGGTISAASEPGRGTTLTFTLPLGGAAAAD